MRLPYRIVRPLARMALKTYFSKIYLSGLDKLPEDKPVILAANHPSAFLEPCILATTLPRPLHFLAKGKLFRKAVYKELLLSLHMIPIFRQKDNGLKGVKNNFSSLDYCFDLLNQQKQILILAEGTTIHEKRLRSIQKGTARMAIGAIEKYPNLDVYIIPIGVNYTDILSYRSEVMLELGEPIIVQDYLQKKDEHRAKTIQIITQKVTESLQGLVIIIDQKADESLCEALFQLYRNNYPEPIFPIQSSSNKRLQREREIAKTVNVMDKIAKEDLYQKIQGYQSSLTSHQLADEVIVQPNVYSSFGKVGIFFGYIPYLIGYFLNIFPVKFGKYLADTKVKAVEMYASVAASGALATYIIYFLALLGIALGLKSIFLVIFVGMIPFFGFFALQFYEYLEKWKKGRQFYRTDAAIIQKLKIERKNILRQFEQV